MRISYFNPSCCVGLLVSRLPFTVAAPVACRITNQESSYEVCNNVLSSLEQLMRLGRQFSENTDTMVIIVALSIILIVVIILLLLLSRWYFDVDVVRWNLLEPFPPKFLCQPRPYLKSSTPKSAADDGRSAAPHHPMDLKNIPSDD